MKRVLLTGGTGFIGKNVTRELILRGYEVHSLVCHSADDEQANLVQHHIDLMDSVAVNAFLAEHKFESLIHLAWFAGAKCHSSNVNIDWTIASLDLLRNFAKYGGKTFLGAGSVSEYNFAYGYLKEDETPTTAPSLYGQCKASVYNMAKVYCKSNALDFKWARIFNLYGADEKTTRLMPSVINSMIKNEDVKVSDCVKIQDYLHVFDTARGIVDLFESKVQGAVNICSGTPIRLRTIVEKIAELTKFQGTILWGAIPSSFDDPFVVGSNAKLTQEIGWKQQISLEEGLIDTITWWRKQNV